METTKLKKHKGGAREGAGRKKIEGREICNIEVTVEFREFLKTFPGKNFEQRIKNALKIK